MSAMDLTEEYVKSRILYDEQTGEVRWLNGPRKDQKIACIGNHGYIVIRLQKKLYLLHRIVWLYMTGSWPQEEIDHKDNVRTNNRWANLRECSHRQNTQNKSPHGKLSKGVIYTDGKFRASIYCGRVFRLGNFDTEEEASKAYIEAAKKLFGEFAHAV